MPVWCMMGKFCCRVLLKIPRELAWPDDSVGTRSLDAAKIKVILPLLGGSFEKREGRSHASPLETPKCLRQSEVLDMQATISCLRASDR